MHFDVKLGHREIAVLINNTFFAIIELVDCSISPPWYVLTVLIELSTVVIKAMSYFMSNNSTNP